MFYLLSLITGILECGWIMYGVAQKFAIWQTLCFPLAYHIGNLFPVPFSLNKKALYIMSTIPIPLAILTLYYNNMHTIIYCVCLFMLSVVIQSVRSSIKSDGNRLLKRVFRVGGFLVSPIAVICPQAVIVLSSIISILALGSYKSTAKDVITPMNLQGGYSMVMIFHQLHYFFYAHIILSAMGSQIGVILAMVLFCGTWLTYMSVEPVMSKITSNTALVFSVGHIGISILLSVMSLITVKPLFVTIWLITGFCGGVVYTISAEAKKDNRYDKNSMTISENIGHTTGLIISTLVALIFKDVAPQIMLILASISAMFAVITMAIVKSQKCKAL